MSLSRLKASVWRGVADAYRVSGISRIRHRGAATILTYHRILSQEEISQEMVQAGMYVQTDVFRMHMECLREWFDVISLEELVGRWQRGSWSSQRASCVVTFDDGWLDNFRNAFPILQEYRIPATIFLPTDYIGTARWFWPDQLWWLLRTMSEAHISAAQRRAFYRVFIDSLRAGGIDITEPADGSDASAWWDTVIEMCKELEADCLHQLLDQLCQDFSVTIPDQRMVMNWDEVHEMSKEGITFGSHSCSHRLLDKMSMESCRREVVESYRLLRARVERCVPVMCYPNGNYNRDVQQVVKEAGYVGAVSCHMGLEHASPSDLFALRRISLHQDISSTPSLLALALSGLR